MGFLRWQDLGEIEKNLAIFLIIFCNKNSTDGNHWGRVWEPGVKGTGKAVLSEELQGAQRFHTMRSRVPSIKFIRKK